jgi:hypothetical protein
MKKETLKEPTLCAYVREAAAKLPGSILGEQLWSEIPRACGEILGTIMYVALWFVLMAMFPISIFFLAWLCRKSDRTVRKATAAMLRREGWPEDE